MVVLACRRAALMRSERARAGTLEEPGRNVRAKRGLNRSIFDQDRGMFADMLKNKLVERGGELQFVEL
jgi:putative transposase